MKMARGIGFSPEDGSHHHAHVHVVGQSAPSMMLVGLARVRAHHDEGSPLVVPMPGDQSAQSQASAICPLTPGGTSLHVFSAVAVVLKFSCCSGTALAAILIQ